MKKILFLLILACLSANVFAQAVQTIRGSVLDKESKFPIIGATVALTTDLANIQGATVDEKGEFRIEGVKVGRNSLKISSLGYKDLILENIIVNSGKETILDLTMEEAVVEQQTVVITATQQGETRNEMATVSARQFSVEETDRYAGSRGDPARMASNFAGVQGADDSRNDIVIRGNSPGGVVWRFEPVPFKFATTSSVCRTFSSMLKRAPFSSSRSRTDSRSAGSLQRVIASASAVTLSPASTTSPSVPDWRISEKPLSCVVMTGRPWASASRQALEKGS